MTGHTIEVEVQLDIQDYRHYVRHVSTKSFPRQSLAMLLFVPMFVAACTFIFPEFPLPPFFGAGLLIGVIFNTIIIIVTQRMALSRMEPVANGFILGHRVFRLDDEALESHGPCTTIVPWDAVWGLDESETHFYVMLDRSVAFIFPKRCFDSEQQMESFAAIVRDRATGNPDKLNHPGSQPIA